jgi:hypothetical protein
MELWAGAFIGSLSLEELLFPFAHLNYNMINSNTAQLYSWISAALVGKLSDIWNIVYASFRNWLF